MAKNKSFSRYLSGKTIELLKSNPLFNDKLSDDIKKGLVFPAIRPGYIDFYYKGQRLFHFENEFKTHIKFASVFKHFDKKGYILEKELNSIKSITNFSEGYEAIKKNCSLYAKLEGKGVSDLYSKYSYAKANKHYDIVVLDIEIVFQALSEDKATDRVDLLLLNTKEKELRFYEAKRFADGRLWSKEGASPLVLKQLSTYEDQIHDKEERILHEYRKYIDLVNDLFALSIEKPTRIDPNVALLIFNFNANEKKEIETTPAFKNIRGYYRNKIADAEIKTIWNNTKLICVS